MQFDQFPKGERNPKDTKEVSSEKINAAEELFRAEVARSEANLPALFDDSLTPEEIQEVEESLEEAKNFNVREWLVEELGIMQYFGWGAVAGALGYASRLVEDASEGVADGNNLKAIMKLSSYGLKGAAFISMVLAMRKIATALGPRSINND